MQIPALARLVALASPLLSSTAPHQHSHAAHTLDRPLCAATLAIIPAPTRHRSKPARPHTRTNTRKSAPHAHK